VATEIGKGYVSTELDTKGLQSGMENLGGLLGAKLGPAGQLLGNVLGQKFGKTLEEKGGIFAKLGEAMGGQVSKGAAKGVEGAAPEVEQSVGKLAGVFGAAGPWGLAAGAAVAASVGIGAGLYKLGGDFESNYRTIARSTGATGQQLTNLKGAFNAVLAGTPASMGQVASTVSEVQRYTGTGSTALVGLSKQLITVSRLSGTEVAGNVEAATHALENWNVPVGQAKPLMDALYTVSQQSGQSFASLAGNVTKFGPAMRVLGYNFTQAAAMMGTFSKAGIQVPRMMMGIQVAATNLAKQQTTADTAVTKAQDKLIAAQQKFADQAHGPSLAAIQSLQSANLRLKQAEEVAATTTGKSHVAALLALQRAQLSDVQAQQRLVSSSGKNKSATEGLLAAQKNLAVAEQNAARIHHTTIPQAFAATIDQIKHAKSETDALAIASKTFGARGGLQLVDAIRQGKFNFQEMNAAIRESPDAIAKTADRTQTLGGAFGKLKNSTEVALQPLASKVFRGINNELIKLTKNLIPIVNQLGKDLPKVMKDLQPIFGIIGRMFSTTFQLFGDELKVIMPLLKAVFDIIGIIADLLTGKWSKAWGALKDLWSNVWKAVSGIPKLLGDMIEQPFKVLGIHVDQYISDFVGFVTAIPGEVISALSKFASTVGSIFTKAWGHLEVPVKNALISFWNFVVTIPSTVFQKLWQLGGQVWSAMSGGFAQAVNGAANGISSLWRWVSGIAGSVVSTLGDIGTRIYNWASAGFARMLSGASQGLSNIWGWVSAIPVYLYNQIVNGATWLYNAGVKLMSMLGQGIVDAAKSLYDKARSALGPLGKLLPKSPAKEGPLSGKGDPYLAGQTIMQRLASGITVQAGAARGALSNALNLPMGVGGLTAGGGGGPVVVIENAHFSDPVDVEAFMKKAAWMAKTQGLSA